MDIINTKTDAIPSITRTNSSRAASIPTILTILGIAVIALLWLNDVGIGTAKPAKCRSTASNTPPQRSLTPDPHTANIPLRGEMKLTLQGFPARPSNLTAAPGGSGEITLSWDDLNDTAITKYQYRQWKRSETASNPERSPQ